MSDRFVLVAAKAYAVAWKAHREAFFAYAAGSDPSSLNALYLAQAAAQEALLAAARSQETSGA